MNDSYDLGQKIDEAIKNVKEIDEEKTRFRQRDFHEQFSDNVDLSNLKRPVYVIQEHHSSKHHWDLRLEYDGVLNTWALWKAPPQLGEKRLSKHTRDVPVGYALFEGIIPDGTYGAGTVKIWDIGTFSFVENKSKKIVFDISGNKLHGRYCLVNHRTDNWLFFKK